VILETVNGVPAKGGRQRCVHTLHLMRLVPEVAADAFGCQQVKAYTPGFTIRQTELNAGW